MRQPARAADDRADHQTTPRPHRHLASEDFGAFAAAHVRSADGRTRHRHRDDQGYDGTLRYEDHAPLYRDGAAATAAPSLAVDDHRRCDIEQRRQTAPMIEVQ